MWRAFQRGCSGRRGSRTKHPTAGHAWPSFGFNRAYIRTDHGHNASLAQTRVRRIAVPPQHFAEGRGVSCQVQAESIQCRKHLQETCRHATYPARHGVFLSSSNNHLEESQWPKPNPQIEPQKGVKCLGPEEAEHWGPS